MDSNSLELKVSSCKDLRGFNFFQKLSAYALVTIASDDPHKKLKRKQQQRTPADGEGDGNPEWNHEMRFDLSEVSFEDCDHLFLHFDLRHQGVMFGDKSIGEVRVVFKDLITEESNLGVVRSVSYQVRGNGGKPNGVLSFSYKVSRNGTENNNIIGSSSGTSSHEIHYPTLDVENDLSEEPFSAAQYLQEYPSGRSHHTVTSYYPPADAYYPPPPPPPPPLPPPLFPPQAQPPPPPPMLHGACYHGHPPRPHNMHPWAPEVYESGGPGGSAQSHDGGGTWSNGLRAGRYPPASFWNGR